jgi:hypothetical protein
MWGNESVQKRLPTVVTGGWEGYWELVVAGYGPPGG